MKGTFDYAKNATCYYVKQIDHNRKQLPVTLLVSLRKLPSIVRA